MNSTLRWHLLHLPAQADPGVHFHVKSTGVHCKCIFPRYIIRCTLRKPARADPGLYISTLNLQVYTAETNEKVTNI